MTHSLGDKDLDTSRDLNPQLSLALGRSSVLTGKENRALVVVGKGQPDHACYCEGIRFI